MRYLKEENTLEIPEEFEQSFFKDPFLVTDLTATMMLKSKGIIDNTDIKILLQTTTEKPFNELNKEVEKKKYEFEKKIILI